MPRVEITIRGESFDGGIPTRIMQAFIRLQKAIDGAETLSVHGEARRITKEDRKKTELVVAPSMVQAGLRPPCLQCSTMQSQT